MPMSPFRDNGIALHFPWSPCSQASAKQPTAGCFARRRIQVAPLESIPQNVLLGFVSPGRTVCRVGFRNTFNSEKRMHKQRIAILLFAAVGTSGTFLPWLTIAGAPTSAPGIDRWITLGLFAVTGLLALAGNMRRSWQGGGLIAVTVPAILASAVGIYELASLLMRKSAASGPANLFAAMSPSWGLNVVTAAGVMLVAAAFALQGPRPRRVPETESIAV